MRITRIYLRNYRVFEQELDLAMPSGLVGVYGVNGGGKSSLIESILWTIYGRSRTKNEEIRTTGVLADCITELEFEHEGHLYLVRRTITGINSTVKAEAFADGAQVATGVGDVKRYVHSVLGMDDAAFRASVFAEQKQVAAFSLKRPAERRDLVLKLLGITPLDAARDRARADAKVARDKVEQVRGLLQDVDDLKAAVDLAVASAEVAEADARAEETAAGSAAERAGAAQAAFSSLDEVRVEHEALLRDGKAVRAEIDGARSRIEEKDAELARLASDATLLDTAQAAAAGVDDLEAELRRVEAVVVAEAALGRVDVPAGVEPPDDAGLEAARAAAEEVRAALDGVSGELRAAESELARARAQLDRSASLSADEDCPVCGQELGDAFASVQQHRRQEVDDAESRLGRLVARRDELATSASRAVEELRLVTATHASARKAAQAAEQQQARRAAAETTLAEAVAALGRAVVAGEADELQQRVSAAREAAALANQLIGQLRRRPQAEAELAAEQERLADAEGRRAVLLEKVRSLGFDTDRLTTLRTTREEARVAAERVRVRAVELRKSADKAQYDVSLARTRLADAETQHAALAEESDTSRHLGRLSELLNAFRTNVVATVGPRLSAQAAELFSEFTDAEYDLLRVDPETYEIQIVDGGRPFGMDRFSGSEIDLANLALRIAISEHVRFQSGGAVGLLVLDEVFGPLDEDRKERMLLALERLRARFGQVLVVTHANEIKEQLPSAIEVIKLPGRRATARVIGV
ncbi:MAG TPA: SMC family ATPase [Acidimicrobiales bacterium]|nr:SMC family ATPase [Acidimicrobiales bacterium]